MIISSSISSAPRAKNRWPGPRRGFTELTSHARLTARCGMTCPSWSRTWLTSGLTTAGAPRLNFASPLVNLASTQASRDRLFQIALVIFRMIFEDRRNLPNRESEILTLHTYYPLLLSGFRKQSVTSFNSQRSHEIIVSAMLARVARCSSNWSLGGNHPLDLHHGNGCTDSNDCMKF